MAFVYATYLNHVTTANPQFERVKDSSLHALNNLLTHVVGVPNAALRQQILEALGLVPAAKQQTYVNALNYARLQLNLGIAAIPYAYPVHFVHRFDAYEVAPAAWGNGPNDNRADGWFEHTMRVTWASSNGNMHNLNTIWNRERVTFQQHPASPPFRAAIMQNTPQMYFHGVAHDSSHGFGLDNHFFMHPSLMVTYPVAAAVITAHQEYEYSPDAGMTWYQIPGGQFVFDRGVRQSTHGGGGLVFFFAKRNRAPANTRTYRFEVEYPIGPAPANPPLTYAQVRGQGTGNAVPLNTHARVIAQN